MRSEDAVAQSEHHLQLFDSSKSLAESVSAFLRQGFDRGEPLLIVATAVHTDMLLRRLEGGGMSVRHAQVAGRLTVLDAEETLYKFMRNDTPNAVAFEEVIGTLVARLADGRRMRIYGEMVDVLAARGNYKGAQQLEELWNGLGCRESFTLFCGYASGHFGNRRTAAALAAICRAHTHVHRKPEDLLAEFLLREQDEAGTVSRS